MLPKQYYLFLNFVVVAIAHFLEYNGEGYQFWSAQHTFCGMQIFKYKSPLF